MSTVTESLEQQLVEEGLRIFKYIVENSIDAILMTDSELQIVYSNRACNQLMARNVTGQPLMSLWFEEDLPLLDSIIERARVGGFFSAARLNGFHSVIDQYPDIEIVGTLAADWDREKGRQAAGEFLRVNPPGALDVIWAASGEMGLGAMLAVEAAGRQDEIKIFTNDVTPESANRMREGRLMAETHHGFPEWGWYGTKFAVMLALGQDVPHVFDIRPRTMYKDNADLFYPTPALEPIDWQGIKADQKLPEKIVIGWAPADISGVYKTANDYFEKATMEGREHGINVEVITRTPATHVAFADQVAIIEDYIQRQVDLIAISAIEVEVIRRAIKKANEAGIPVIIVNQLEPIEGMEVTCYIGFDNTVVGAISAYSVVDYLGGPGILGEGEKVEVEPGTYLDLAWWQALYKDVDPRTIGVKGRVAIIEGISGSWRGENRLVRSGDSVVYVDAITFPVRNKVGEFVGLVASFRDATQRKEAEGALRKARDELEIRVEERTAELAKANRELLAEITERKKMEEDRARLIKELQKTNKELIKSNQELKEITLQLVQSEKMSALGELTAGVAHELNQPLNGIKIISQSILRDMEKHRFEEDKLGEDLTEIVHQVNKMAEIIDHMRVFTRKSEGMPKETIDLNTVIEGPFKLLNQQLKDHNIEVVTELAPALPRVMGDPIRLEQVFMNLITNARIAVDGGGKDNKRIEIRTYKVDNRREVAAEVRDNGSGIPEDLRDKIFQPFFTTTDPGKGTGLGLSVSGKIMEEHRGRIELESEEGKGSTFRVILPIAG
jgi:ABC-type sugar transport system substrate-binding protein/signal transduction histidine kinase